MAKPSISQVWSLNSTWNQADHPDYGIWIIMINSGMLPWNEMIDRATDDFQFAPRYYYLTFLSMESCFYQSCMN